MDQQGAVANPARGQLNRIFFSFLSPFASANWVSRDEFDSPIPRHPTHSGRFPVRLWFAGKTRVNERIKTDNPRTEEVMGTKGEKKLTKQNKRKKNWCRIDYLDFKDILGC